MTEKWSDSMASLSRGEAMLLLSFFSLLHLPLFYILRFLDHNTLTSWRWVFGTGGFERLLFCLPLVLLLAWLAAVYVPLEKRPVLSLALLSALAIPPLWQEPELLLDSARYFLQAKFLAVEGPAAFLRGWGGTVPAWTDLPLIPFGYGLLFQLFGETRLAIQLFNTLIFFLTGIVTLFLGREIWDAEIGAFGALLLLGIPYLPTQVPLMLVDVHTMFLVTLALLAFLKALRQGGLLWLAATPLAMLAAVLTKYSVLPMLAILLPVIGLASGPGKWRTTLARVLAVGGGAAALVGGLAAWQEPLFRAQLETLLLYQWPALGRWQEGFVSTFLFQIHPLLSALVMVGAGRAAWTRDRRFLIPGAFFLVLLLLEINRLRYLLPLLPLFTLMASYGLVAIQDRVVRRFLCCTILFSSLLLLLGAYLPFFLSTSMMNLKEAGRFLDTLPAERVEVRLDPQELSEGNTAMALLHLDLFTRKQLVLRAWPGEAGNVSPSWSPLRFTWEIGRPSFYAAPDPALLLPLVVITGVSRSAEGCGPRPDRPLAEFTSQAKVFRYQTLVTVCP